MPSIELATEKGHAREHTEDAEDTRAAQAAILGAILCLLGAAAFGGTASATDCPSELPGWPVRVAGGLDRFNSFTAADIWDTGENVAITTSTGALWAFEADGLTSFQIPMPGVINAVPTIGDLDGDLVPDIAISAGGELHFVIDGDDQLFTANLYTLRPLVIADVNGDALDDIILLESVSSTIHVFHRSGGYLTGWPRQLMTATPPGRIHSSCLAIADLDGDGTHEIVVQQKDSGTLAAPLIFALNADGTMRWSFDVPVDYETFHFNTSNDNLWFNDIVIGDVDADGALEIVYFRDGWRTPTGDSQVIVLDRHGSVEHQWVIPVTEAVFTHVALAQLALGDMDGDGDLEIAIPGLADLEPPLEGRVFAWHHDGSPLSGFPVHIVGDDVPAALMMADVDEDGRQDIVSSLHTRRNNYLNRIFAWSADGASLPCWPDSLIRQYPVSPVTLPPFAQTALHDLDQNGTLDLIAPIGSMEAHARDLHVSAGTPPLNGNGALRVAGPAWPMFRHDPGRTGAISPGSGPSGIAAGPPGTGEIASVLSVTPNPSHGPIRLEFENPARGRIELRIYDPAGRLVDVLTRTLGAGPAAVAWPGAATSRSGVWFARLSTPGGEVLTARFLLIETP